MSTLTPEDNDNYAGFARREPASGYNNNMWPAYCPANDKRDSLRDGEAGCEDKLTPQVPGLAPDTTWASRVEQQPLQQNKPTPDKPNKCKYCSLRGVAIVMVILGGASYLFDPLEHIHEWSMKIAPGSRFLDLWQSPPLNIFTNVYIFNFTNTEAFLAGTEKKLRIQEIGPFVFKETLLNTNVVFNKNGTMTYTPKRTIQFQPQLSVGLPSAMRVMVPNIALLGLGSMMAESGTIANLGVLLPTIKYLGSKPFLNLTAEDYLWGYEDPLVDIAHTLVSNWIPFAKLGLLDRMYDEGDNEITIRLQDNGLAITDPGYLPKYSIATWNGSPGLAQWGYLANDYCDREDPLRPHSSERCKLINGASEGILYPRNLNPNVTNYIYRKTFCRHLPVEFKHKGSFMPGIPGNWYGLPDNVFDTAHGNPETKCYCDPSQRKCLPKGLADITPCYYNIPAAVSYPHFYNGDPALLEPFEGLAPDKEKHGSYAVLQPELGSMVDFTTRIQTNLVIRNIRHHGDLIPLANLHLPFFWVELTTDGLPLDAVIGLYFLLVGLPIIITTTIILGAVAAVYLAYSALSPLYHKFIRRRRRLHIQNNFVEKLESPYKAKFVSASPSQS